MTSPRIFSLLFALTVLFGLSGCGINNIPTYDEEVKAAWSQVLNQYKRRADLVPNLVNTVKGFAAQEKEVLTEVTKARASVAQMKLPENILTDKQAFAEFQAKQAQLGSALSRLMLVVERYPNLKSSQNFLTLQSQLEGAENRISVARRDYIMAVQKYNTELRTIPGRWWAAMLYPEMELRENFSVENEAEVKEAPQVQFE